MTSTHQASAGPPKCPPAVQAEIKRAIALHLREHGNRDWDLVRELTVAEPGIGSTTHSEANGSLTIR